MLSELTKFRIKSHGDILMNYKPNPLLYGADENFFSTFKIAVTMRSEVDHEVLSRSVDKAMVRYPYFSIHPVKKENHILLCRNPHPVPVFEDDRFVVLGTEESYGHLLTFGCRGRQIFLNASHYIADGMGIDPLLKTVLGLYVSELYGTEGLEIHKISMPDEPVSEEEYAYPFPDTALETDDDYLPKIAPNDVYELDGNELDDGGFYAYHLHIPQKTLMKKASPSDGSPISFLSVMLYRALCSLNRDIDQPIVAHIQHQYRAALNKPDSRHSMVSYIPVTLPLKMKERNVTYQNTVMRGQILLGSERSADLRAVNRLLDAFPAGDGVSPAEKKQAMRKYVENSVRGKTFGISYVGKTDWCGLDRYVEDIHVYLGEKNNRNMLLIEIMTIGEDFTVNFMQSGCGKRYVNAFIEQLRSFDIPVTLVGEERYTLCDTKIPE